MANSVCVILRQLAQTASVVSEEDLVQVKVILVEELVILAYPFDTLPFSLFRVSARRPPSPAHEHLHW